MKISKLNTLRISCMTLLAAMIAACSSEDSVIEAGQPAKAEGIPFTATISMDGASTRTTLTEAKDGSDKDIFTVEWNQNDKVELIYQVSGVTKTATANVDAVDNSTRVATISATLSEIPENGVVVTLRYPASSLDATTHDFDPAKLKAQTGTLAGLGAYDWREGTGTLSVSGSTVTLSANVKMESKVAIWKLSPKAGGSAINAKRFYIKNASGDVLAGTASTIATTNTVYLALQPFASQKIFMEASDGTNSYDFLKDGVAFAKNTYYQSEVTMTSNPSSKLVPLTLEALTGGSIYVHAEFTISYSVDDGASVEISAGNGENISVTAGQKVSFYSTNSALAKSGNGLLSYTYIKPNIQCYVYGNVMSLIDDGDSGFANDKTISADLALTGLFLSADKLINHPTRCILLPATTLASRCYQYMFYGCSSLTTAPDLPAKKMASQCYNDMFRDCNSLTTAPDLPATELASGCYNYMFSGCSSLTTAPDLRATELASSCYAYMFSGCSSLTTAPDLPATTLAPTCYYHMFEGCTKLNYLKCLATNISAEKCLLSWLNDAGTADGCERKVYVKSSMLNVGTEDSDGQWRLATSGTDEKRWTLDTYVEP